MPTYEYQCACGEAFEEFQSITSEPYADCPKCGETSRRQISAGTGLIFKGSGFYITDYKNKGTNGSSAEKSESKKDTSTETKSESKKSETKTKSESKGSSDTAKKSAKA